MDRAVADPPCRSRRGTHRSITVDAVTVDLVAPNSTSICRWCLPGWDAVESPPVPRSPPHEITRKPCCAWELAAFAASCRNGLMTLFNGQSDCMDSGVQTV